MKVEEISLNEARNVKLTAFIQAVDGEFGQIHKRPAILILPGGGYSMCSDREAEVVAFPYLKAGYQAFVLRYSVNEHKTWPNPLNDYEQAMELIVEKQEEWHILADKIAVVGFSAGGHLAGCAATVAKHRPNAVIIGYGFCDYETGKMCIPDSDIPITKECVDGKTPPCFLFACRDDSIVDIQNTVSFQQALLDHDIMFEAHVYAYGGHGFSTGDNSLNNVNLCSRAPHWVQDSIDWLRDVMGVLGYDGMSEPVCPGKINGNYEDTLSIDCTIAYLKNKEEVKGILGEILAQYDVIAGQFAKNGNDISSLARRMKLREFIQMVAIPKEQVEQIDKLLNEIKN